MNQLFAGRGRKPKSQSETYSPQQLELLRLCNTLLQRDNKEIFNALAVVMRSLLALSECQDQVSSQPTESAPVPLAGLRKTARPRIAET